MLTIDAKNPGRALVLTLAWLLPGTALHAQAPDVYSELDQVAVSSLDTPNGQGLLPTALAEADVALQHARLAAADSLGLIPMRNHAGHVMHALDPAVVGGAGPGLGYGVRRSAMEAQRHLDTAASADSVSENVAVHVRAISTSLANVVQWSDQAVAVAQQVQSARSVSAALPLVSRLLSLCHAIRWGRDADGDGIVGWQQSEGGLAQAEYHMTLLRRGEGLGY